MYVCKQYIVRCMEGWPSPTLCASCDGENKKKKKKKKKVFAGHTGIFVGFVVHWLSLEFSRGKRNSHKTGPLIGCQCYSSR